MGWINGAGNRHKGCTMVNMIIISWFHKIDVISFLVEELSASQQGLWTIDMELSIAIIHIFQSALFFT